MGIDGGTVSLVAARGDVVLVTFFASWCTNCRDEFPAIEAAYTDERARGFAVIGVNTLETGDGPAFYHSLHASFPAVRDPGQPGNIAAEYDVVSGLPASFFIARDGTLADAHYGVIDAVYIQMELGRLL
jgi:peroxiredoxin